MDGPASLQVGSLNEMIRALLQQTEAYQISFASFMEQALYHPIYGYYSKPTPKLGKAGDFFTNVYVSDLFGRVLARYFLGLWRRYGADKVLTLVEVGGGDGRLLEQITTEFQQQKIPSDSLQVYSIERSNFHRKLQEERLMDICYPIHYTSHFGGISPASFAIVYSNELVDSFPVHRLRKKDGYIQELYVTEQAGKLIETFGGLSTRSLAKYCEQILEDMPDGQQFEVNLAAHNWLQEAAGWLRYGFLLTVDYGGTSRELRSIRFLDGTMRYYQKHQHIASPYENIGEIDITAHVNFDDLVNLGMKYGLKNIFYGSQTKFLISAGILQFTDDKYKNAIKQLLLGMGESFQVLVQQK